MWGAQVVKISGYDVTIQYIEDTTGETITETETIPKAPEPTWLGDLTANRIVDLSKRTAVLQSIVEGPITPTAAITDAAQVSVSTSVGKVALPPIAG